jgi:UDP-N-acetylglucosamine:LPS N-acetylglucosamine transferase
MQLRRIMPAFEGHDVAYVTTIGSYRHDVDEGRFYLVNEANLRNKFGLLKVGFKLIYIIVKERPDVVISTGAAPGYIAIRLAKLIGARTIWVDSIANVDALSLSGQKIRKHAGLWLTQWPHLARAEGPHYRGAVL